MPLALLLLIFCPPTSNQPCANTWCGTGWPAAISIAGQMTAWKRAMSLPTMWMSAGQRRSNFSSSEP